MKPRYLLYIIYAFFGMLQMQAQETLSGSALLDKLISDKKIDEAETTLNAIIEKFIDAKQYDSLGDYSYYVGNIEILKSNKKNAQEKAENYYARLKSVTNDPAALRLACMSLASLYDKLGMPDMGFSINEEALVYTAKIPNAGGRLYADIHSNLGTSAMRNGDIKTAIDHYRKTIKNYKRDSLSSQKDYYFGYSSMGTAMYYSSKIDSSIYFYEKAIAAVQKLDTSAINLYYRPSILYNNIAGLYSMEGNSQLSLEAMKKALAFNKKFINSNAEDYKISDAKKGYPQAIDNFAGIYQTLGDYQKAHDLLLYSERLKLQLFDDNDPEIFKTKVLLGQSHVNLKNYEEAAAILDNAIARIEKTKGNFITWNADAHYSRAQVFEGLGDREKTIEYYIKAEALFNKTQQDTYDESYLNFLKNQSLFLSKNNQSEDAISAATKAYNYVIGAQGQQSLPALEQTITMAKIYANVGNYEKALAYSKLAFEQLEKIDATELQTNTGYNIIIPEILFLKNKARFDVQQNKSVSFLTTLYEENNHIIELAHKQTRYITTQNSITLLHEQNNALYSFSKKVALLLFEKTGDKKYLDKILTLHEANIYSKIRNRLNAQQALQFSNVPIEIIDQEQSLKKRLNAVNNGMEDFLKTETEWSAFIKTLEKEYPKYFNLRYENPVASLAEIQKQLKVDQTAVRYLFIEEDLYVLILTQGDFSFKKLAHSNLEQHIHILQQDSHAEKEVGSAAHLLYNQLWQPIEKDITTTRVLIIPDAILFNLSFETLSSTVVDSFKDLASSCLLNDYAFSYNFSLQIVAAQQEPATFNSNYVGFAPGFSTSLKEKYANIQQDSVSLDYEYLRLLPQPFSVQMVAESKKNFGGSLFLESDASEENFIANAPQHKIIQIGTHATSNNISPELSRLVFAKSGDVEDNYLYTYEIYNTNLSSNLTVLTACETGKPTYQPGEGMISLAHAFNYAGSESMLTSLWKIDEKSSTEIVSNFYKNLKDGTPKDVALQKAKIDYLANAQGRTLAPQYWGGLILIGDTSPLAMDNFYSIWVWILIGIALLLILLLIFRRKK